MFGFFTFKNISIKFQNEFSTSVTNILTPLLATLARTIDFGMVVVRNIKELTTKVCPWTSVELADCMDKFLSSCDKNTELIHKPLIALRNIFCSPNMALYRRHHECYLKLYVEHHLETKCSWGKVFYDLNSLHNEDARVKNGLCYLRQQLITCLNSVILRTCGLEATRVQNSLLSSILRRAFIGLRCKAKSLQSVNQILGVYSKFKRRQLHFYLYFLSFLFFIFVNLYF